MSAARITRSMDMDDRTVINQAKYDETSLRDAGKPYSEAVIALCDMFLNCFPLRKRPWYERAFARDNN